MTNYFYYSQLLIIVGSSRYFASVHIMPSKTMNNIDEFSTIMEAVLPRNIVGSSSSGSSGSSGNSGGSSARCTSSHDGHGLDGLCGCCLAPSCTWMATQADTDAPVMIWMDRPQKTKGFRSGESLSQAKFEAIMSLPRTSKFVLISVLIFQPFPNSFCNAFNSAQEVTIFFLSER